MASETRTGHVPDIVSSLNLAVANTEPASIVLHESLMASPSPMVNIHPINCEVQSGDGVRFGNEIYIMTQRPSGEPVLYEATNEFKNYLRSQSVNENKEPKQETCLVVSGNNTQELPIRKKKKNYIRRILISVVCLAVVCGSVVFCNSFFYPAGTGDSVNSWYVDRSAWYARQRNCPIADLQLPIKLVIMTHTAGRYCQVFTDCRNKVRDEQANDLEKKLCDIKYGFLVGGDSRIFEGRAFRQRENISDNYSDKAIMIGFIGNYNVDKSSKDQFDHLKKLLDGSLSNGHLSADYKITAADRIGVQGAPGKNIRDEMSSWDRWTEHPEDVAFFTT